MQILQQIISSLTGIMMTMQASLAGVPGSQLAQVSPSATLSLTPVSSSANVNSNFTVSVILNTGGQDAYGVDINKLRFDPSVLQVVDSDGVTPGVQISPGILMPLTIINSVDNSLGTIQFSQLATPGSTYRGSGTVATVTFRGVGAGTSNTSFDFSLGSGTDSNVAGLGGDLLVSVGTGSYTVIAPDTTPPSAPGTPSLNVVSSSRIDLSWVASTDNVAVSGYRVERCSGSSSCSNYSQISTPSTNSYSDTGLNANTVYRYRVRSVDSAGNLSSYSSPASATTQAPPDTTPPTISSVAVSNVGTSGATISWTTNEPADTQVDYGVTASYGFQTVLNSSLLTSHSASITGLSPATTYHFRVRSKDAAGNLGLSSDSTFTTNSLPDTTAPSVPTGLSATPTSETQVQLSWSASTDPAGLGQAVSGISGYRIFRNSVQVGTASSTAYLDTGLSANTTYSYRVSAVDNAGNVSSQSLAVSATTPIFSLSVQRRIVLTPEGAPAGQRIVTGTVKFLDPANLANVIYQASIVTNSLGQYVIDVPAGLLSSVTMRVVVPGYLSKLQTNVDLRSSSVVDVSFPSLPAGDFNEDQLINSLDFSYMNGKWSTSDSLADLNRDSAVNSLDFAFLSNNWLSEGE